MAGGLAPVVVWSGEPSLTPFSADYYMKRSGFKVADVNFRLSTKANGQYIFESSSRSSGFVSLFKRIRVTEKNTLAFFGNEIKPVDYIYQIKRGRERETYRAKFDWQENIVDIDNYGKRITMDVPAATLNRFTLQLVAMQNLAGNEQKSMDYPVLYKDRITMYRLEQIGEEKISTPAGTFVTQLIKAKKISNTSSRTLTFWCAKKLQYLPVKIVQKKNDKTLYTMFLKQVDGL